MDYEDVIARAAAYGEQASEDVGDVGEADRESDTAAEAAEQARWELITELHRTTDRDAFEAVLASAMSGDGARRLVGLDALGQIGYQADRPYREETLPVLIGAADDRDAEVVASAVTGLGHLADSRGLPVVLRQAGHESDVVRFAVACALPMLADADEPPADVVDALITLTADPDPDVRDWATFGLGTQLHADGPEIRDAFAARLADSDDDALEEAVMGLALRGDPRATGPLVDGLWRVAEDSSVDPGTLLFEAAALVRTQDALPPLRRLWERRDDLAPHVRRELAEALAALGERVDAES